MIDDGIPQGTVTIKPAPPEYRHTDIARALMPPPAPIATWRGAVLRTDAPTINGHIYPKEVIERALAKARPDIASRKMIGTFYDADYPRRLKDAAFVVADIRLDGDLLLAEIETLPTPQGRILCTLLSDPGCAKSLRFRTEGNGSLHDGRISADYSLGGVTVTTTASFEASFEKKAG